jgi:hypothetical protein
LLFSAEWTVSDRARGRRSPAALITRLRLGKIAAAIRYFSKAISAQPNCEVALLARAEAYMQLHTLSCSAATANEGDTANEARLTDISATLLRALTDYTRLVHAYPTKMEYR